jgi:hypothetical protein
MKEITYQKLIERLKDPKDPLWGGSLSYIEIEESLALTEKILAVKRNKAADPSRYEKIQLIARIVENSASEMIEADGEIYHSLKGAKTQEEKDRILLGVGDKSLAFLNNLLMIINFIASLYFEEKGSIRMDMQMIHSTLKAAYQNLVRIFLDEAVQLSDSRPEKKTWLEKGNELLEKETLPLIN